MRRLRANSKCVGTAWAYGFVQDQLCRVVRVLVHGHPSEAGKLHNAPDKHATSVPRSTRPRVPDTHTQPPRRLAPPAAANDNAEALCQPTRRGLSEQGSFEGTLLGDQRRCYDICRRILCLLKVRPTNEDTPAKCNLVAAVFVLRPH